MLLAQTEHSASIISLFNFLCFICTEPNSFYHVFGEKVTPIQLAKDFETLSKILMKYPLYQKSKLVGPDITSPRGPKRRQVLTLQYLDQFLAKAKNTIAAASWHQ